MAKRNDYITGREDGLLMALEIVKNEGVEALEKEIKFRNVTGIRTALAKKDINRATIKIKEQTVDTVTILSVADPTGKVLPWEQPNSTNPYKKGDRVTHKGKTWESLVDSNVWEPGAVGSESLWKEVA